MALPCIVCKKEVEAVSAEPPGHNHPYAATAFTTHGHYGSTIFDPMTGQFLEVNVCDPCLREAGEQGRVLFGQDMRQVREGGAILRMEQIPYRDQQDPMPWTEGAESKVEPDVREAACSYCGQIKHTKRCSVVRHEDEDETER